MLDYKCTASTVSRPPTTNSTRCPEFGGELNYAQVDVRNTDNLDDVISDIANKHRRIDGMIAAAGVQQVTPAVEYGVEDAMDMMNINYTGVFMSATATARQMIKYKCRGSICLIASMSGMVPNKGLLCPVYNSSKAAVIQLAKNLAMEWVPCNQAVREVFALTALVRDTSSRPWSWRTSRKCRVCRRPGRKIICWGGWQRQMSSRARDCFC